MAELSPLVLALLGVFGLAVGSFLNVVIVRMPDGDSIVSPPSRCPECGTELKARDNIPVVSWLVLRGRCRTCREPIPAGYPLVELANGVLWVLAGLRFGASWALVPMLLLLSTLLAQSVIDLELYRLLDKITFPVLGASIVLVGAASALEGDPTRIGMALLGSIGFALFLFLTSLIRIRGQDAMGLGDVKLALLLGLYLGWIHPVLIGISLMAASIFGVAVGAIYWIVRRESTHYPFGPWLAIGCVVTLLWSNTILDSFYEVSPPFLSGPGVF